MVINPYTFLPVSDFVIRRAPHGHAGLAPGRFSGSFQVRLTARTPLLIGPLGNGDVMPPTTADGATPIIPGSSLAGAVRSIHEAMNNSCLRVVDEGYRAVHRLAVSPDLLKDTASQRLRMAVVTAVTEHGLPSRVALCDKVVWVPSDKFSFPPQTGDRVALPEEPQTDRPHQRPDRLHPDAPSVGKSERPRWTVLVTDLAARRPDHPVYFACGRLELQTIGGAPRPVQVSVPDLTQAALARAIETSADLHGDGPRLLWLDTSRSSAGTTCWVGDWLFGMTTPR